MTLEIGFIVFFFKNAFVSLYRTAVASETADRYSSKHVNVLAEPPMYSWKASSWFQTRGRKDRAKDARITSRVYWQWACLGGGMRRLHDVQLKKKMLKEKKRKDSTDTWPCRRQVVRIPAELLSYLFRAINGKKMSLHSFVQQTSKSIFQQ